MKTIANNWYIHKYIQVLSLFAMFFVWIFCLDVFFVHERLTECVGLGIGVDEDIEVPEWETRPSKVSLYYRFTTGRFNEPDDPHLYDVLSYIKHDVTMLLIDVQFNLSTLIK